MKYKIRKLKKAFSKAFHIYITFPQVWVFLCILIFTIIAFVISISTDNKYWQALSSNIFAGLITGLVLSALSGVRQVYAVVQQRKKEWLQELHKMILDYYSMNHDFSSNKYRGLDRDDYIYDMGARTNWIKEFIIQSTFDRRLPFKTIDYCKKSYAFDVDSYAEKCDSLYAAICERQYSDDKRSVWELFRSVDSEINTLNRKICNDIKDIEIKIATSQRSII